MRSSSRWAAWMVFVLGLMLCVSNLWFTAARTTIPLSLQLEVMDKEIRREKHPGLDDIHLLRFVDGSSIVVDEVIYDEVVPGQVITKDRWSRQLHVGDRMVPLEWSADSRGMLWVMPAAALMLFVLVPPARAKTRRGAHV